ncbi:MAG: protein SCO1/2 [Salibacteraceae bacterium]|jgi:protein SCO1/2
MKKLNNSSINILAGLLLLLSFGCTDNSEKSSHVATLPFYNEASFIPHWFNLESDSLSLFHSIPTFELSNQNGISITEETITGKIVIADFFFATCPGICPKMTENMHFVQSAFKNDEQVIILSHSVTPRIDSVSALREYANEHQIQDGKWHLLTGDRSLIYGLGRNSYFVEEDLGLTKKPDDFLHTENFVLLDKRRRIRGIYNGLNKGSVNQLIADVKTLQAE